MPITVDDLRSDWMHSKVSISAQIKHLEARGNSYNGLSIDTGLRLRELRQHEAELDELLEEYPANV